MIMSKVFDKVIYVGYWICVAIMVVCTLAIVMEANAQTMDHDSIHDIMELSNPICYIDGKTTKVDVVTDCHECEQRSYLQMVDIEIYPQYYMWEHTCSQFQHNHFTDYEVPELHNWHTGTWVRVTYLHEGDNWTIYNVSPRIGAVPMVTGR